MRRHPPGVSIDAAGLVSVYAGASWIEDLATALRELHLYGCTDPALFLPNDADPAANHWPVRGRRVRIIGELPSPTLRRLLAALMRDGAGVVAGLDTDGNLHRVSDRAQKAAV